MMTRTVTSIAVMAALGLLAPINVNAFGLGKLELSSALNEPFKAEIAITALEGDDANNLQVRLASKKEFEQAGIARNFLLTKFKFDVIEKSGNVKIVISSQQPIREPFIDFLLTATTTGSGRLIREYTVLLDPPKNIFKKSVQSVVKTISKPSRNESATTKVATSTSVDSYGPTNRKDTLWDVALKTRPDRSITVNQMMMALLQANPTAFHRGNINGLKAGHTLSVPSKEEIYKLSKQQAINVVREQNSLWKNRNVRSKVVTEITDKTIRTTNQVAQVINTDVTEEKADTAAKVEDNARLKLVVPNDEPSLSNDALSPLGAEKIKDLSEQLTLAQETIEGQSQETIDFKARMDAMEEQMNTMRRLMSLKDADLARLQSMLEQGEAPDESSLPTNNMNNENIDSPLHDEFTATQPLSNELEEVSSVEKWEAMVGKGSNADSTNDLTTNEVDSIETTVPATSNADTMPLDSTALIVPVTENGLHPLLSTTKNFAIKNIALATKFVANNKNDMLIAAGSLLALLVGLLFFKRRKEADDSLNEAQEISNSDAKATVTVPPTTIDEDKQPQPTNITEVAPIVEIESEIKTVAELIDQADKLVGYANYDQANTVLEQAKEQEPTNQTVLIKLLFVLFKKGQKEPFVAIANRLSIDKESDEWADIANWGRALDPLNELFNLSPKENEPAADLNYDSLSSIKNDEVATDLTADQELSEPEELLADTIEFNLDGYKSEAIDTTDNLSTVVEDKMDNDDESLSFDTPFSVENENKNEDFDAPLSFESEEISEDSALSLNDEPLSVDFNELPLESEDLNVLSIDDGALDTLEDLHVDIESQPENDTPISLDINEVSIDVEVPELLSIDDGALDTLKDINVDIESEPDNDNFGFDLNGYDEIDEAETKLDLASAYADMGDPDGARNILEEVLKEGSDEQKTKAQALLDSLT